MRILAFTDIHGGSDAYYVSPTETISRLNKFKKGLKEKNIDLIVCTGDFTLFGDYVEVLVKKIADLGVDVILIHGNHEDETDIKILTKRYENIHFIHKKKKKVGDYFFIGYGGGGFSVKDSEFTKTMKNLTKHLKKTDKIILLTHGPAYNTKLDAMPGIGHVGNKDYRKFIETHNVILNLSGHIHEGFGKEDKIKKARIINPGYKGKIITLE